MKTLIILGALVALISGQNDPASLQLVEYRDATNGSVFPLTTSSGRPVSFDEANFAINKNLNLQEFFIESITHLIADNIPDRIVHAKGAGARGYFEVTQSFAKYSRAKVFDTVGKRTPVAVRIGPGTGPKGGADLARTIRGLAVKFYTEEGNFDIPGMNTPMFLFKDPLVFSNFVHAFRPNPVTHLQDFNAIWDMLTFSPESLYGFLYINSDFGIGDNFRTFDAYSIHTIQVENANGDVHYVRFHMLPENGTKYIGTVESLLRSADYGIRDLYNAIAQGNYPAWILYAQIITPAQLKEAGFTKIFDTTRIIPTDQYPLTEIGRFVLNKNPTNYHAEVEQIAFCPSNLVPGISGGPDAFFESRRLVYRAARNQRLGINSNNIPVNRPLNASINYLRDGAAPINPANYNGPNYYPNSYNGPKPLGKKSPALIKIVEANDPANYDQATEFYNSMDIGAKARLLFNIGASLSQAQPFLQEKAIGIFRNISDELADNINNGIAAFLIFQSVLNLLSNLVVNLIKIVNYVPSLLQIVLDLVGFLL